MPPLRPPPPAGVVLLPGSSLPLLLHTPPDVLKVERAVRVREGPTARLIAAVGAGCGGGGERPRADPVVEG